MERIDSRDRHPAGNAFGERFPSHKAVIAERHGAQPCAACDRPTYHPSELCDTHRPRELWPDTDPVTELRAATDRLLAELAEMEMERGTG